MYFCLTKSDALCRGLKDEDSTRSEAAKQADEDGIGIVLILLSGVFLALFVWYVFKNPIQRLCKRLGLFETTNQVEETKKEPSASDSYDNPSFDVNIEDFLRNESSDTKNLTGYISVGSISRSTEL